MIAALLSLADFNLHSHWRKILLTEHFEELARSQGVCKSASKPVSEAFSLAFFYLHTRRRIFLRIEVFEVKARKLSILNQS